MHVAVYLFFSYLAVDIVVLLCVLSGIRKRTVIRWPVWIIVVALLVLPLLPYAIVEAQTHLLGPALLSEARRALRELGLSERLRVVKVLSVSPRGARVYTVTPCMPYETNMSQWRAVVIRLVRGAQGWSWKGEEEDIWSDCGSAHGNVFPPYLGQGEN